MSLLNLIKQYTTKDPTVDSLFGGGRIQKYNNYVPRYDSCSDLMIKDAYIALKNMHDLSQKINQIRTHFSLSVPSRSVTNISSEFSNLICKKDLSAKDESGTYVAFNGHSYEACDSKVAHEIFQTIEKDNYFMAGLIQLVKTKSLTQLTAATEPTIIKGIMQEKYIDEWSQNNELTVEVDKNEFFQFIDTETIITPDNENILLYVFTTTDHNYLPEQFKMTHDQVMEYTNLTNLDLAKAQETNASMTFSDFDVRIQEVALSFAKPFEKMAVTISSPNTPQCQTWESAKLTRVSQGQLNLLNKMLNIVLNDIPSLSPRDAEYYKSWFTERLKKIPIYEANTLPIDGIPAVYDPKSKKIIVAKGQINLFLVMHELLHSEQNFDDLDKDPLMKELDVYRKQQDFIFWLSGRNPETYSEYFNTAHDIVKADGPDGEKMESLCKRLLAQNEALKFIDTVLQTISNLPVTEPEKATLRQQILARIGFMRAPNGSIIFAGGDRTRELITPLYKDHYHLD